MTREGLKVVHEDFRADVLLSDCQCNECGVLMPKFTVTYDRQVKGKSHHVGTCVICFHKWVVKFMTAVLMVEANEAAEKAAEPPPAA